MSQLAHLTHPDPPRGDFGENGRILGGSGGGTSPPHPDPPLFCPFFSRMLCFPQRTVTVSHPSLRTVTENPPPE